ncbi:hypothetical protein M9H77_03068 [Catharanthus roseus]|uniref:Uncharacterized protein n=1 Tax=Catharanthus roseus TaxID=4058 RepID=A0ACC0CAC8_CATRO|nr:hypothetical protein M9H77_03068 [Catharanthus roseus]
MGMQKDSGLFGFSLLLTDIFHYFYVDDLAEEEEEEELEEGESAEDDKEIQVSVLASIEQIQIQHIQHGDQLKEITNTLERHDEMLAPQHFMMTKMYERFFQDEGHILELVFPHLEAILYLVLVDPRNDGWAFFDPFKPFLPINPWLRGLTLSTLESSSENLWGARMLSLLTLSKTVIRQGQEVGKVHTPEGGGSAQSIVKKSPFSPKKDGRVKAVEEFDELDSRKMTLSFQAMNILSCRLDADEYNRVRGCDSSHEMWKLP